MDLRILLLAPVFAGAYLANDWSVSKWSPCNVSCGGGVQRREVFCGATVANSKHVQKHEDFSPYECWHSRRPAAERPCNTHPCPSWVTGPWTQCSATCDKGWQFRQVLCRTSQQGFPPEACSQDRPTHKQPCYADVKCGIKENDDLHNLRFADRLYSDSNSKSSSRSGSNYMRSYGRGPLNIGDAKPSWLPENWGHCSATCGKGMESRDVKCMVLEPLTRRWKEMDEINCIESDGPKPPYLRPCELKECPISEQNSYVVEPQPRPQPTQPQRPEFQWSFGEWQPCTATCLTGVQHQTLLCIQVRTGKQYAWSYCNTKQRPVSPTRKCNAGPCPANWKKENWQPCPKTCGRGTMQRRVWCAERTNNTYGQIFEVRVDDSRCGETRPVSWQYCGEVDCPATWVTEPWSPCTKTCGEGEQRRRVFCSKLFANGTKANLYGPQSKECHSTGSKPPSLMICANMNCNGKTSGGRKGSKGRESRPGVLNLKAWGEATVYENRPIKIRCPDTEKNSPKDIVWKHGPVGNEKVVESSRHRKISNRGKLRIFRFKQKYAGLYSCYVNGHRKGAINLSLKQNRDVPEYKTKNRLSYTIANANADPGKAKLQLLPQPEAYHQPMPPDRAGDVHTSASQSYKVLMQDNSRNDFRWVTSKWSACPQTCGTVATMQIRNVVCVTRVGNRTQTVTDRHCERIAKPHAVKVCGEGPCPSWTPGEWSDCETSKCTRYMTAVQSRELFCTFPNTTVVPKSNCDRRTRPRMRKTCTNSNCSAEWKKTEWTECTKSCGTGVQMRTISCYWKGTRKPARNACEGNKRPSIIRTCNEHGCAQALSTCSDQSRYCSIVRIMRKCNQMKYREKCCLTCYHAPRI